MEHRRAAVVGAGVTGLTAARILATSYEVTPYEADSRLGGHSHTHEPAVPGGRPVAVDPLFHRRARRLLAGGPLGVRW
ncbi:NAD(P)-binding protein [Streptomyces sp. NPDC000656]|uniref:NAD(P)-binding protein n=1 Tax=unclassified Streptomyces TaxID=2593676 RepID=UPI00367C100E